MVYDLRISSRNFANVRRLSALPSVEEDVNNLDRTWFSNGAFLFQTCLISFKGQVSNSNTNSGQGSTRAQMSLLNFLLLHYY